MDAEMTFWDHLEALRWMLIRSLAAVGVCVAAVFVFVPWIFDHVVMAPADGGFFLYRALSHAGQWLPGVASSMSEPFKVTVVNLKLPSQFFLHISIACWLGLLVAFPYVVSEVWRFVCPAFYANERRSFRFVFVFGTVMFYLGCAVGYAVVFPMTLRFLYTYSLSPDIVNQLSVDSYMDNFLMLVFMMGIAFELPLLSMLLSRLGIIDRSFFSRYRRHAVVALLVAAAVITPSSDPFTLMAVFLPIYVLWEVSALLVRPAKGGLG